MTICKLCNKSFEPTLSRKQVYCIPCRQYHGLGVHAHMYSPKICKNCGSSYIPRLSKQQFCSVNCNKASRKLARLVIFTRDNFRCIYCGISSIEHSAELHLDHIIPKSLGGTSTAKNLVTACSLCNFDKSNIMLPDAILTRLKTVVFIRNFRNNINGNMHVK